MIVLSAISSLFMLPTVASTGSASSKPQQANAIQIPIVSEARAIATVPAQKVGAAYMAIKSPIPLTLIGAESDIASEVQIHTMHTNDGVMRMRQQAELLLPANTTVSLVPGATHLMLVGLKRPLKAGDAFMLKL